MEFCTKFFYKNITDLIYGTSEEKLYISSNIELNSFLNVINSNFSNTLNLNKLFFPENGSMFFINTNVTSIISVLMFAAYVGLNLLFMIKTSLMFLHINYIMECY